MEHDHPSIQQESPEANSGKEISFAGVCTSVPVSNSTGDEEELLSMDDLQIPATTNQWLLPPWPPPGDGQVMSKLSEDKPLIPITTGQWVLPPWPDDIQEDKLLSWDDVWMQTRSLYPWMLPPWPPDHGQIISSLSNPLRSVASNQRWMLPPWPDDGQEDILSSNDVWIPTTTSSWMLPPWPPPDVRQITYELSEGDARYPHT